MYAGFPTTSELRRGIVSSTLYLLIKMCRRDLKMCIRDRFLIGHITKEGVIAGPKVLEHIVDVVLQFEGDRHYLYRILRGIKNRFGSTSELGIYEMRQEGCLLYTSRCV